MSMQDNLARMLRKFMKKNHLTYANCAKLLQISSSALQSYLKGTGNPEIGTIEHLAQRMGIDPAVLLTGEEPGQAGLPLPRPVTYTMDQAQKADYLMELALELSRLLPENK